MVEADLILETLGVGGNLDRHFSPNPYGRCESGQKSLHVGVLSPDICQSVWTLNCDPYSSVQKAIHTDLGFDEHRHVAGLSALDSLEEIVGAVNIPVQAVDGLFIEQAIESLRLGAKSVVIGAPLAIAADRFATSGEFEAILREVVNRVAKFKAAR
jgi:hypothetical protein